MFERYTEKARRVIFFARYEASEFGSPFIDTEHLLLGLIREEKLVTLRWIPNAQPEAIRTAVSGWVQTHAKIPTSVDLPLSEAAKHVLEHAKEEADGLKHKHIGTEHLLLGLLQEECKAASLLKELGGDIAALRARFAGEAVSPASEQTETTRDLLRSVLRDKLRSTGTHTVQIHGLWFNADYVREGVKRCRMYNWHWQQVFWKPRDVVIHRKSGKLSLDLTLAADAENFELLKSGWKKDRCAICNWELFESPDDHGRGYTNGQQWVCLECYEKFWDRPEFLSGSYSDLT